MGHKSQKEHSTENRTDYQHGPLFHTPFVLLIIKSYKSLVGFVGDIGNVKHTLAFEKWRRAFRNSARFRNDDRGMYVVMTST